MDVLRADQLAARQMEVFRALLRGFCAFAGMLQHDLAADLDITREHLSYLLHRRREPGPKVEAGIRRSKRLPQDLKDSLLSSLWSARLYEEDAREISQYERKHRPFAELVVSLGDEYTLVTLKSPPGGEAKRIYSRIYARCNRLTEYPETSRGDLLSLAQLCTIQADVGLILGGEKLYEALQFALMAEAIMEGLLRSDFRGREEAFDHALVNAIRVRGMAYQNLDLFRQAYQQFEKAESTQAVRRNPDIWGVHMAGGKLSALAQMPRFTLQEAESLAAEGRRASYDGLQTLLLELALARCYITYGSQRSLSRAGKLLGEIRTGAMPDLNRSGTLTPLHQVMVYRTCAALDKAANAEHMGYDRRTDTPLFDWVRRALWIARQAAMGNEARKLLAAHPRTLQQLERQGYVARRRSSGHWSAL